MILLAFPHIALLVSVLYVPTLLVIIPILCAFIGTRQIIFGIAYAMILDTYFGPPAFVPFFLTITVLMILVCSWWIRARLLPL